MCIGTAICSAIEWLWEMWQLGLFVGCSDDTIGFDHRKDDPQKDIVTPLRNGQRKVLERVIVLKGLRCRPTFALLI